MDEADAAKHIFGCAAGKYRCQCMSKCAGESGDREW